MASGGASEPIVSFCAAARGAERECGEEATTMRAFAESISWLDLGNRRCTPVQDLPHPGECS
jgi:hypothetical protein